MKFEPVIKRSGSKRSQSEEIVSWFPKEIETYYEPFIGGGSVLFQLLNSDVQVKECICSDVNEELITLWRDIRDCPELLATNYEIHWNNLNKHESISKRKEYYYYIRERFNKYKDTSDLLFLTRTCANGLIRYNSKGEFNTSFHFSRKGIAPDKMERILFSWSNVLNQNNVQFVCRDYKTIIPREKDFMYLDPPYANTKGMYFGQIDYDEFWNYLRHLKCDYIFSFDGKTTSKDNTYEVPKDVYSSHIYMNKAISGFGKIHQKKEYVQESLYLGFNPHRNMRFEL